MNPKIVCVFALIAGASAQMGHKHGHASSSQYMKKHDGNAQEVLISDKHGHKHIDYFTPPKYEFEYKVDDDHTGDHKAQEEHRDEYGVKGSFSVHQLDGSTRHVQYHGDHSGFHADVKHETHHVIPEHHHYHSHHHD